MTRKLLSLISILLVQFIAYGQAPDTCNVTTAERLYGGNVDDYGSTIISTSDGGYLLVGYTNSFGSGGFDGYVVKLDGTGAVQWAKAYGGALDDEFSQVRPTSDGGYVLGGYTESYGDPAGDAWIVKIDANGNLQWSTKYGDGNPNGDRLFDLIQTADGGYAFVGDHKYIPGTVDAMVVKLDANGNLIWAKGFDSGSSDEAPGIAEDHDSLVVSSFYLYGNGYNTAFMKIEETAGNVSWLRSWACDGRTNRIGTIWIQPDGYAIYGVNSDGFGITNPWQNITKTDFNGNIIYDWELHTTTPDQTMNGSMHPTADGGYIVGNFDMPWNPNSDIYITKIQSDGSIDWSRTYPQPGQQSPAGIIQTADGGYASLNSSTQGTANWDMYLIKTDSAGLTNGCSAVTASAYIRNPTIIPYAFTWPTIYDINFNPSLTITPTVTDATSKDSVLCLTVNFCHHLLLTGSDSICGIDSTMITYHSIRDSGCVTPIQWSVDTSYATIVGQTDSTVQLHYKQPGSVTLFGKIVSTCGVVSDSLPIDVIHTTSVALGNDTGFCAGGNVVLDAGSGFQSYSWNTGATTEQIVADSSGTYWVAALNPNGSCLSADTVAVTVFPSPVVNLGPDTSICQDSVYRFDAGIGFTSYLWQDGSTGEFFNATLAGTYWVKVDNSNGCTGSDTARILSVQPTPVNFLEPTAEVCSEGQQPIVITAIGSWAHYLWSDSSTGPSITVALPGVYSLQVSSSAGCTAQESINVIGKQCPFGIFFPNAFTPNNDGKNDVFRPIVYSLLDKFYMAVYDRWGVRMFETTNPSQGWDGTFNGHPQPQGTYVWYTQYTLQIGRGNEIIQKGSLMLIR